MSIKTIAITGVGGGVGQSILKSLYNTNYRLIALDGELLAAGLYTTSSAYKIPYAKSAEYIPTLIEICKKESCDLLFPGLDAELSPLSLNKDKFEAIGTTVVVSSKDVIDISDDKMITFEKLINIGVKVPFTCNALDFVSKQNTFSFPLIIKQKVGGARSKNVFLIKNDNELSTFLKAEAQNLRNYIIQEHIEGDEYTCGSVTLNNECKGVIVMRRILRDGDTYKCFVENNTQIESTVRSIVNHIKPFGACNIQLRLRNGIPYVFEINARCSGTTASRTLCGFNEPKMISDYLLFGAEPVYNIEKKTILRYWKELVVNNNDIEQLGAANFLALNNPSYL